MAQKSDHQQLMQLVCDAVKELNTLLDDSQQIPVQADTKLFGVEGLLDSLALVNLIVMIEERVAAQMNQTISLTHQIDEFKEKAFHTIQTLAEHVGWLISKA